MSRTSRAGQADTWGDTAANARYRPISNSCLYSINTVPFADAVRITNIMVSSANDKGADAIVGIRFTTSAIMDGSSEILVFGTAIKFN